MYYEHYIDFKWPKLDVFLDITTVCNAGCPMCHRTDRNGLGKVDWLPIIEWSIEDFKKAFPKDVCEVIRFWQLCGTFGDPIANKDIIEIVKYCKKFISIRNEKLNWDNTERGIHINTNGSLRDEDFWWDLGVAGGKELVVDFAVEGINQEMHEKYRQRTSLKKILKNMETLSHTEALIETQTIVFKHNQDYLEEIEKMCIDYGSIKHKNIYTDRWSSKSPNHFEFIDSKGNKNILEKAESKQELHSRIREENEGIISESIRRRDDWFEKMKYWKEKEYDISCEWMNDNRLVINSDGNIIPCCYFALPMTPPRHDKFNEIEVIKKYDNEEHNVFKKNLIDILKDSNWFNKHLPNSWEKNPTHVCKRFCGTIKE